MGGTAKNASTNTAASAHSQYSRVPNAQTGTPSNGEPSNPNA